MHVNSSKPLCEIEQTLQNSSVIDMIDFIICIGRYIYWTCWRSDPLFTFVFYS